jgi:WD40 repeat protein
MAFQSFPLLGLGILLTFASCARAQTLSTCRPPPPMPANAKPGVGGGLTLTRDGKTLVVPGGDARIRFIDLATGTVQRILTGHTNMIYRAVLNSDEKLLGSSSRDHTARIWDAVTGRELHKFEGFRCAVKGVAFSPNGQMLAASGNDGMLKIWDVQNGKELKSLIHINSADIDISVYSVIFNRDGKKIYAGNGDGTISEWEVASGKETKVWKAHKSPVVKLVFSPDYGRLASLADGEAKLWDTADWHEIRSMSMTRSPEAVSRAQEIVFSHDGKLVVASDIGLTQKQDSYIYIQTIVWNVANGAKLFTIEGHKWDISGLVFTKDDRFLLTGSVDTTIKFWDMKTGELARTITIPPAAQAIR